MKKLLYLVSLVVVFTACNVTKPVAKSVAYAGVYSEKPLSVLIMPPINRSTNVEAKEFFHSTLNVPIANAGYYVIPPFLSMEILKKESAYDAELFLNNSVAKFGEVFGADVAMFTIIHKWDKSGLAAKVSVEVEYIFKSTKTNEVIFTRKGNVIYDASVNVNSGGLAGALVGMAISAINTAATKYVDVARACNAYTLMDLPAGKYSPTYGTDGEVMAGQKEFRVMLNSSSGY